MVKLDIGCGKNKTKSNDQFPFIGVDILPFDGVDLVCDLSHPTWIFEAGHSKIELPEYGVLVTEDIPQNGWKFADNSVDEVFCSHFIEHLDGPQRILFFNELFRVMKPGAKALIIAPDWSHYCSYGDPTHKYPPISAFFALYLNAAWRDQNAPHVGYTCDFDWVHGASWDEWLNTRANEVKEFAMQRYVNSARDIHITLSKRG